MGIPALWRLLGDGEVVPMAKLASDHFKQTGQAFKVAIDEAAWRFKNLTETQVAAIREREPAANPIEKAIFWRICRLMRAHIHPIFVFDGPSRPWKRGRKGGGRINYERTRLLEQLLDRMSIPHHRAPGEAEAERARMQQLGMVNAVWSDDADSLMFGAGVLIRDHRGGKGKTAKHEDLVQVYRACEIREKHGLDVQALVAYVTLVGGDYDMKGLLNCGEETVNRLGRDGHLSVLGRTLCAVQSERDLSLFRQELMHVLAEVRKRLPIPSDFPTWRAVKYYKSPKVSNDEQMEGLKLRKTWDRPINHDKLRELLRDRFNIWTKAYFKYLGPILLLRELTATEHGKEHKNSVFDVTILKTRKRPNIAHDEPTDEIKISYRPLTLMPDGVRLQPSSEDWQQLATKDGPFEPSDRMELETLRCLVIHGKSQAVFDAELMALEANPTRSTSKRRNDGGVAEDAEATSHPRPRKKRSTTKELRPQSEESAQKGMKRRMKQREEYNASKDGTAAGNVSNGASQRTSNGGIRVQPVVSAMSIDLTLSDNDSDSPRANSPPGFRQPRSLPALPAPRHPGSHIGGAADNRGMPSALEPQHQLSTAEHSGARNDLAFGDNTLEAIQQSLIKSHMIPDPKAAPERAPLEPSSVNVRVASEAAKALLLSPRSAVRQRWAAEGTLVAAPVPKAAPALIDLTTA